MAAMPPMLTLLLPAICLGLLAYSRRRNPIIWGILGMIPKLNIVCFVLIFFLPVPPIRMPNKQEANPHKQSLDALNAQRRAQGLAELEELP